LSPSPTPDSAAPQPTPTPTVTPLAATPSPTPTLTPVPEKTVIVTPKRPSATVSPRASEAPKAPSSSAKARSTQRTAQVSPTARVNSTRASSAKAPIAAAREDLPRQLPRGVTPRPAAVHEEVGVPGVAEGVEGAPLPLDRTQSLLSAVYATRARMRIQSNFNVPPDVNDPSITCVVEWEITPDGTIRNIRVVKSTGIARLDACAVEALRKTGNLGPLPPEWGNRSVWTSLTFMFAGDFPSPAITDSVPASANPRTSSP
ncbi:MAG: cell envelope integrity protein TolA, partial [Candidatus Sumerlaeaceae bacterium]|nr:cell envelope integrity protein TolA [Candidatus Sumerlaeaceae bacterium]